MLIQKTDRPTKGFLNQLLPGEVFSPQSKPDLVLMVVETPPGQFQEGCKSAVMLGCPPSFQVGSIGVWLGSEAVIFHPAARLVLP